MESFRKSAKHGNARSPKDLSKNTSPATDSGNVVGSTSAQLPVRSKTDPLNGEKPAKPTLKSILIPAAAQSKKRVSIDLTASDDEQPAKHQKINHNHGSLPRPAQGVGSFRIAVVLPPLRTSSTAPLNRTTKNQNPKQSSRISKTEYAERLRRIPGPPVTLCNIINDETPSTNFKFINEFKMGPGTKRLDPEFRTGCNCRQENGRNVGCEYLSCECLEESARKENGKLFGFPYYGTGQKAGCMREMFLNSRYALFECNSLCSCHNNCRGRVVQKGRTVRLEIFKTKDRGWGLRSLDDIQKGQFIDRYLGEVITDEEATRRENAVAKGKESFLFSLDKFQGKPQDANYIPSKELYVVDGEFMGGPTRFINHSCAPNCRQFTVTSFRGDLKIYDLAFFALEYIPALTELSFDYKDKDVEEGDEEEDDGDEEGGRDEEKVTDENVQALEAEKGKLATKCLCRSENCRQYLWL